MNRKNKMIEPNDVIYLLFVLVNILAMRETFLGNQGWSLLLLITFPLFAFISF